MDFHSAFEHRWRSLREKLDWRKSTRAKRIRRATLPRVSRTLSRLSSPRPSPRLSHASRQSSSRWNENAWLLDVLRMLTRSDVDSCQLTCHQWYAEVEENSCELALRHLQHFSLIAIERSKKNEVLPANTRSPSLSNSGKRVQFSPGQP